MSKDARTHFIADFETTTREDDCRVWAWGLAPVDHPERVQLGTDIISFFKVVSHRPSIVYFHNLKFDGTFILDWLLRRGYRHTEEQSRAKGEFSTLISESGQFYSITVRWANGNSTEFRDSLKKVPLPVSAIAKAYKLEESKGEIDYEAERPVGHQVTADEADYIRRDVTIVGHALKAAREAGMTRLTVGSDALAEYKSIVGKAEFKRLFPTLSLEMDEEIRRAYRGGFTYADPRFSRRFVGCGQVYDVNSLYPYVMDTQLLPYGVPQRIEGVEGSADRPLTIFGVTFTARLKPDHIPCIQIKSSSHYYASEYQTEISDPVTLMVTSVDWELYNDHYDIDVLVYHGGWSFQATYGMYSEYIDKWSQIKRESTGGLREIAKLHLNSLYGKFATHPNVTGKVPYLKDDRVAFRSGAPETRAPVYTPVAAYITAYARALTIRAAQAHYGRFAYADTDSLHLLGDEAPQLDVDESRFGAWKKEYDFTRGYYLRAKAYGEDTADGTVIRVAGLPHRVSADLTLDDLHRGGVITGKLAPVRVPGGVVLKPIDYTLE